MDGVTKHTYESIRIGASFETLVNNIRLFVKERNHRRLSYPSIDLQMVVTQKNIHEVDDFSKLIRAYHHRYRVLFTTFNIIFILHLHYHPSRKGN